MGVEEMTDILICPLSLEVFTEDGTALRIMPSLYENDGTLDDIHGMNDVDIANISGFAVLRSFSPTRSVKFHVPDVVLQGIKACLAHYLPEHEDDCYDFVNDVFGVRRHAKENGHQFWETKRFCFWKKPGDVLFLLDTAKNRFIHAAIYLGRGYCLSVHGKGGAVGVSNTKHMCRDYGAKDVHVMRFAG